MTRADPEPLWAQCRGGAMPTNATALLGLDIGTSSTKAVVLSVAGQRLATASQVYAVDTPQPDWAEQDPERWVAAALVTTRQALARSGVTPAAVAAIGLAGQMHGTVCVGSDGRPLRPAIIWADQRSVAQVSAAVARLGRDRLAAWTGNPLATGFMLPSWLWLRKHEPELMAATRWLLLPKDYVRYRLTGEIATEPSDAASTSLFDPVSRCWSKPLLVALGLDAAILPPIRPSSAIAGRLLPAFAAQTGLRPDIPIIAGGSDQAAQALGHGVVTPGVISSTIGTGGQLFAPTERPVVDAPTPGRPGLRMHSYCHVLPHRWHVETAMLAAGLSLRWLRDQVLDGAPYSELADTAAAVAPGADGLLFQPYLMGERTPHMDPRARGSFVGLTRRHGPGHLVRALMEGVVFGMRQGLDVLRSLGVPVEQIVASGGAVRHRLWLQLQADIYGRAIRKTQTVEAAATGAAMLAGIGVGCYRDAAEAIAQCVAWDPEEIAPDPVCAARYEAQYEVFTSLYPALAPLDHALGAVEGMEA